LGHGWRGHELADGVEDRFELGVVFSLQVGQLESQLGVGEEHFTQAHEGAHDGDVDLHGPPAAQDAGEHGDTLFREGVGAVRPAPVYRGTHHSL
jgi:hypothetical protein